jgi:penicillin G amidase
MKVFRLILSFSILFLFIYFAHTRVGQVPPLGKLLNPKNGFWQNAEAYGVSPFADKISIKGLKDEVIIKYDSTLIPHIFAKNEHDMFMAQGYITAKHRLWQMETQMRFAAGRIAEVLGEGLIDIDKQNRRIGLAYGAEQSLKEVEKIPELYEALQAYTNGVNAYIENLDIDELPIEYKILDYEPEPWSVFKNVLLLKYMSQVLAGGDNDMQNSNLVRILGKEVFDLLFPDQPEGIDPVIPNKKNLGFEPLEIKKPENLSYPDFYHQVGSDPGYPGIGSNNWAVSGEKSATGNAILSNDPHLNITIPSLWILTHLHAPGYRSMGVTIPGMAGILLGFNDSISWGLTNSPRDLRDWYLITFKDETRNEYLYDDKWLKTQKRIENIGVKGGNTIVDTVIYTHYGPIVFEDTFNKNPSLRNYALRWSAHDPSLETYIIYQLNKTKNYEEFTTNIQYLECPPQNIVFASTKGDIAMWVSGKFPLKWKEQGKFLMDGANPHFEWQEYIPQSHNAHVLNPERNFVSSANQHPFDNDFYPYYFYNNSNEYYRNRIINAMLDTMQNITMQDMIDMQVNNMSLHFHEAKYIMIDSLNSQNLDEEQVKYLSSLMNWDGNYSADSQVAVLWELYWRKFKSNLWDELISDSIPTVIPNDYVTIQLIQNNEIGDFYDIKKTDAVEHLSDLLLISLQEAITQKNELISQHGEIPRWTTFKSSVLKHNLNNAIPYFSIPISNGGNGRTINAMSATHGPSWRMVAEMSTPIKVKGIYPGGQSGNPGSPWYQTFVKDWEEGRLIDMEFPTNSREKLKTEFFTLTLAPSKK